LSSSALSRKIKIKIKIDEKCSKGFNTLRKGILV